MKKGEIYLLNFDPSVGHEYKKVRPALVIQSGAIESSLVTVMPLSSQLKSELPKDLLIKKDSKNRLFEDSILKVSHISSFDKARCIHFIGKLDSENLRQVDKYLKTHFGI